jgi:hypothetical protein
VQDHMKPEKLPLVSFPHTTGRAKSYL